MPAILLKKAVFFNLELLKKIPAFAGVFLLFNKTAFHINHALANFFILCRFN